MTHIRFKDAILHVEDVALPRIAADVGTPVYVYSANSLRENYNGLDTAMQKALADTDVTYDICYASKANSNIAVLTTLAGCGSGADVVTGWEMDRCLRAGIPGEKIVFSGVGKTRGEIEFALNNGIGMMNVESVAELETLNTIAGELGVTAPVAIRVNPDVDAETHTKISTGRKEDKFGIDINIAEDVYKQAADMAHINAHGVAIHIGSQLTRLSPFENAFRHLAGLVTRLREAGHVIDHIDIGGGLGITYNEEAPPHFNDFAALVAREIAPLGGHIVLEPGRAIAGNAGLLLGKVIYVKQAETRKFVILDAAMTDLIRPALYDAWHPVVTVEEHGNGSGAPHPVDIVGPVCESADIFAKQRMLAPVERGDLVAILAGGAYGAVMGSVYNARPITAEVLVDGDKFAVIRRRIESADLLQYESVPEWLE